MSAEDGYLPIRYVPTNMDGSASTGQSVLLLNLGDSEVWEHQTTLSVCLFTLVPAGY